VTGRRAVALVALLAYGWWATGRQPFTLGATLAVVGAGVVAMAWGLRHRHHCRRVPVRRGMAAWAVPVVILIGWQVVAYVQSPRSEHPTLSSMTNSVLDPHPVQAVAFVAWLILAAELAAR
jgi:hypothetical protein